jgi:hypothetical protein
VIVEGSLDQANADREVRNAHKQQQLKTLIPKIKLMFTALDADGSGDLCIEEIANAPMELKHELSKCVKVEDLEELFELIDSDESGSIDLDEFVDGLSKIVASDMPLEALRTRKSFQKVARQINDLHENFEQQMTKFQQKIDERIAAQLDARLLKAEERIVERVTHALKSLKS